MTEKKLYDEIKCLEESQLIDRLRKIVDLEGKPSYICVFAGADDTLFKRFGDSVARGLNIVPQSVFEYNYSTLGDSLYRLHRDTKKYPNDILMAKIRGIEKSYTYGPHGFSQRLRENDMERLREEHPANPKTVVVLTQINPSVGKTLYDAVLGEALSAGFANVTVELALKES